MSDIKWVFGAFWSTWFFLTFVIIIAMMIVLSGCGGRESEIKIVTQEERNEMIVKELCLPTGAKNVNKLDENWHTFDLMIDGRTRKFIRRLYGVSANYQMNFSTDSFTELTPQ